jgi:hypothetical protein
MRVRTIVDYDDFAQRHRLILAALDRNQLNVAAEVRRHGGGQ